MDRTIRAYEIWGNFLCRLCAEPNMAGDEYDKLLTPIHEGEKMDVHVCGYCGGTLESLNDVGREMLAKAGMDVNLPQTQEVIMQAAFALAKAGITRVLGGAQ